jgi:hypothetical protein
MDCPNCDKIMDEIEYGTAESDVSELGDGCFECGLFIDPDGCASFDDEYAKQREVLTLPRTADSPPPKSSRIFHSFLCSEESGVVIEREAT